MTPRPSTSRGRRPRRRAPRRRGGVAGAPPAVPLPGPARIVGLRRRLLAWWDAGHRDLPWRFPQDGADPYRVWLAEVMAQQTRLDTVVPYYRAFLERWPALEALAAADEADVLAAWSGLGYYARARNLLAAARQALRLHGGLPPSLPALRALPGFGPYTAGAVASIAFGIPAPAVDGNATRVLARWTGASGDPRAARRRVEAVAAALAGGPRPGDVNQAVMELGATVCRPRSPRCGACPAARDCEARRRGLAGSIPGRRRRAARRPLALALARVVRGGRLLLVREAGRGLFAGMWGLPGVELPPGADPRRSLSEALRARLGVRVDVGPVLAVVERALTHRALVLHVHDVRVAGRIRAAEGGARGRSGLRWAAPRDIQGLAVPTAVRKALEAAGRGPAASGDREPGSPGPGASYPTERS
jgi:A/G-specific adenine glycosylase